MEDEILGLDLAAKAIDDLEETAYDWEAGLPALTWNSK
jgi:hypothetical protein